LSGEVPWRRVTPDIDCVRRHIETHPQTDEDAAIFDISHLGCFHARVYASLDESGSDPRVVWGYMLPRTADEKYIGGVFEPPVSDARMGWLWRPVSLRTGAARPAHLRTARPVPA
jgi:hypothetical protein